MIQDSSPYNQRVKDLHAQLIALTPVVAPITRDGSATILPSPILDLIIISNRRLELLRSQVDIPDEIHGLAVPEFRCIKRIYITSEANRIFSILIDPPTLNFETILTSIQDYEGAVEVWVLEHHQVIDYSEYLISPNSPPKRINL